jgi:hypothetical protein
MSMKRFRLVNVPACLLPTVHPHIQFSNFENYCSDQNKTHEGTLSVFTWFHFSRFHRVVFGGFLL